MNRIKGLRDINTHGSLDRKGLLTGVAKNMHRGGSAGHRETESGFGGDVSRHIFKKPAPAKRPVPLAIHLPLPDSNSITKYLIATTRDLLEELLRARAEGLPVMSAELKRLEERLKDLGFTETE